MTDVHNEYSTKSLFLTEPMTVQQNGHSSRRSGQGSRTNLYTMFQPFEPNIGVITINPLALPGADLQTPLLLRGTLGPNIKQDHQRVMVDPMLLIV